MTATPASPTARPSVAASRDTPQVRGVLALELVGGSAPSHAALAQHAAGELARLVGRDLGALVPEARTLDLCIAAAHFDPAEVLRPGWPVHRRLDELHARAPGRGQGPRVIAFGADASGQVPLPLQADPQLAGGTLRVLPYLFAGDADTVRAVDARMESILLDTGMAQADTALAAQDGFDARIEHARYLTLHDLLAMTALQYRNAGLEPLWPLLETALLAPGESAWLDAAPEPLLRHVDGGVRIARLSAQDWRGHYAAGGSDEARLRHGFAMFEARQRQLAAVLQAHGIPVQWVDCPAESDPRAVLAD
ncbi:hypothetical protein LDO26_07215 [Luteimonas sp. BDR2-5]|uniref:hypothetical protein n=1 Tax=Proluteimonas luteida TaxID=2878685 RepID=UPI001E2D821E|nr:hypothetical protein [Luteimonas sp. BDR2-5]MCD9027995.1 hypothetical protein [Luteimonas sp. BDR2-5]